MLELVFILNGLGSESGLFTLKFSYQFPPYYQETVRLTNPISLSRVRWLKMSTFLQNSSTNILFSCNFYQHLLPHFYLKGSLDVFFLSQSIPEKQLQILHK